MDKYVRTVLTIVAIGVIGLNIQIFKASNEIQKVSICGTWKDVTGATKSEVHCVNVDPYYFRLSVKEH